jgi:hypothetical protein
MLFRETIAVYSEKPYETGTLCGKNADLLIVKAGGTFNYYWALKR